MKFNSYSVQVFKCQKSASMIAIHSATVLASTINRLLIFLEVCKQSEEDADKIILLDHSHIY